MKTFSKYITDFFTKYLCEERGVSHHTIRSYSGTFCLLLEYFSTKKKLSPDKVSLTNITRDEVLCFLKWIEEDRKNTPSTRNQRLAAIHSFARYSMYDDVLHMDQWNQILSISFKNVPSPQITYLSVEAIKLLLAQIPQTTRTGLRDLALIALLYDSGARVQEICDLTPQSLHLTEPCYVTLLGKRKKTRSVPLQKSQVTILKRYMEKNGLLYPGRNNRPLFANTRNEKLTGAGVTYILNKYYEKAKEKNPSLFPSQLSPHQLRHSKAMHLLQAGVNLIYIRDILGHCQSSTTEIYARADSKQKREAIEKTYQEVLPIQIETPVWEKDSALKQWLMNLGK